MQDNHRLYSHAIRSGLSGPSHDSVINKSHQSGSTSQIISQQTSLGSQVSGVRPAAPSMPAPSAASGAPQISVIASGAGMASASGRYPAQPPFQQQRQAQHQSHQSHQSHRQSAIMPQRPPPKSSSTPTGAVQQAVPQNVGQSNMSHAGHPQHSHFYLTMPQQMQPQIMTSQHMPHAVPFQTHQTRTMPHQGMPAQYAFYTGYPNQQFNQTPYYSSNNAYVHYNYHATHGQQTAQMMSQLHQQRGAQVSAPVIQPAIQVPMSSVGANNEINEMPQMQQKPLPKRQKQVAIITDPNSGRNISVEELASKNTSKNHSEVVSTFEPHSRASNLVNTLSNSSQPTNDVNIALQFATQVAQVATESLHQSEPNSVSSNATKNEQLLPNSDHYNTISDLSETNNNNDSDNIEPNLTEFTDNTIVNVTNSSNYTTLDQLNERDNILLTESKSAQHLVDNNYSQVSVNLTCGQDKHDIQQNGETSDTSNQMSSKIDSAKDHQIQKFPNANQRRKDLIKKADSRICTDELEDIKVGVDLNEPTIELDSVEHASQALQPSPPVMITSLSSEKEEKSVLDDKVCNNSLNINNSENQVDKKNAENFRFLLNDSKSVDLNEKEIKTDLPEKPVTIKLPNLPYKEDQWSPVNPDGKKHYDRDFLIAVKEKTENSLKMPTRLSEIAVDIIRRPHQEFNIGDDPFLPGYAANKPGDYRRLIAPNIIRRQSQPGKYPDKQRKVISTSLTQDVKLHSTENAWKPSKIIIDQNDPEELETLELLKKIRGVLNKLTPQKYDALLRQIMTFKVDTEDKLKRVLDLVFEKAVDEPAFCLQYANLCKHLAQFKVTVSKGDNSVTEEVKFQKLLLSKCQKEFEAEVYASIEDLKERQKVIEECQEPSRKKALTEILDEDMRRARKRSLGNIKLIGELYKLHMLKGNIMVQCIDKLCNDKDDESLECLCALLKTIGEQIEEEAANHISTKNYTGVIDSFFITMEKVANQVYPELRTSSRVRFMLQDVIDMRKNNWKARRDENLPKMIDEIHQEAKKEEQQKAQELQQHSIQKRQEERDKRKTGRQQNETQEWTTIAPRKSQTAPQTHTIDWKAMQKSLTMNHDVQLGPQQSTQWAQGSRGGALSQSKLTNDDKQANRFSLLEAGSNDNRKTQKSSSSIQSRDSSKGRTNQHSYQQSGGKRGRDEREQAINLARNFTAKHQSNESYSNIISKNSSRNGSREHSAPNSRNSSMRRETPDIELSGISQLKGEISDSEMQSKIEGSIKEYLSLKNVEEAALDVTSYCNPSNVHLYITSVINYALEITSHNGHNDIGNLLCHLVVKNIIKLDQFFKGLYSILESAEDIEIDVPKFWDYIGEILAPILIELPPERRKDFLNQATKPCANNQIPKLVAKVFSAIARITNEINASQVWTTSNLSWDNFLKPDDNTEDFLKENKVEFTVSGPTHTSNSDLNLIRFSEELIKLVQQKKSKDEIQNIISKYFNVSQTKDLRFTSALFSAVIRGCLTAQEDSSFTHNYSFDEKLFADIAPVLVKFFGGDPEVELQALILLQKLMEELQYPAGLLCTIFQHLYDCGVISQDAFLQWENCDASVTGKAVAIASVARFLTWLRENEDDDEDEVES